MENNHNIIELLAECLRLGVEVWLSEEGWREYDRLLGEHLSLPVDRRGQSDTMTA